MFKPFLGPSRNNNYNYMDDLVRHASYHLIDTSVAYWCSVEGFLAMDKHIFSIQKTFQHKWPNRFETLSKALWIWITNIPMRFFNVACRPERVAWIVCISCASQYQSNILLLSPEIVSLHFMNPCEKKMSLQISMTTKHCCMKLCIGLGPLCLIHCYSTGLSPI